MNIALILSGGIGSRIDSAVPKQYIKVGNKPIIVYCMEQLFLHPKIDKVQIAADSIWREEISRWIPKEERQKKFQGFSDPGQNRQLSVFYALKEIRKYAKDSDYVLIHDAARPLLSKEQISACFDRIVGHEGVLPVLHLKDTLYLSKDGIHISSLLNRAEIVAGQAPEVFQLGAYYRANQRLLPDKILEINGSAEPAVMAGMDIAVISGEERNFKITTKADLERFSRIIEDRKD